MKMTHEQLVAENMVKALLGEYFVLTEDRIDDLIARYPDAKLNRHVIDSWMEFDPTRNKKYMPWIVNQVGTGLLKLPEQGERLYDDLMTFVRLLAIPAYTGPRDIYQVKSHDELNELMSQHGQLKSKTKSEKDKKMAGQQSLAQVGIYEVIKITNADTLNHWGWRAYSYPTPNPNWTGKPVSPSDYKPDDISDRKWCIRWPRFAENYLAGGPFYLVLKNGGPYVGIVWHKGECQSLKNEGISTAVAEEIYPVLQQAGALPGEGEGGRNAKVFDNLKFLHGDVKDGDTITGPVDLANTQLSQLPSNLTVKGNLELTNCPLKQLPSGLNVEGTLRISGTPITDLPEDLSVHDMEWSEPLSLSVMKSLFYRMRLPKMEDHYAQHLKDAAATRVKDPTTGKLVYPLDADGKTTKPISWLAMKKALVGHFQTDAEIDKNVKTLYRYVAPSTPEAAAPPEE
jgi:hypothetical protein